MPTERRQDILRIPLLIIKMNERIKLLADQCYYLNACNLPLFNKERFAELIVAECLMKAIGAKIRGESIDTLIQNIKEDFGVEE